MVDFAEARLESKWGVGAAGGPGFDTSLVISASGYEFANGNWAQARYRWDIGNRSIQRAEKDYLVAFFQNRRGKLQGFRFKDWTDHAAENQGIGTGDGSTTAFQLVKHYVSGADIVTRTIKKPVSGSLDVALDGVPEAGWSLDATTGVVTFDAAPGAGVVIVASFEFDVPVRFDVDQFELSVEMETSDRGLYMLGSLPVVEIKL